MKTILLSAVFLFTCLINAQISFVPETIESGTFVDGVRTIAAADLDNDGDVDLVSAAINPSNVAYLMWYENDGIGNFTEYVISNNIIVANMRALKLIDIENDGDIDIIGSSDSRIINVRNNGDGTFTPLTIFNASQIGVIFGIDAADLDFDGDIDIIVPGRGAGVIDGYLFWLRNDSGTFTEMPSLWNNSNNFNVKAFDFDNDNDTDIIATRNAGTNSVRAFINDGTGTFTNTILDSENLAEYITIGDTNNDGNKEVFVSFEDRDEIRQYTYNQATNSWSSQTIHNSNKPKFIRLADVNNDGNNDILLTKTNNNSFFWLEGNGSGDIFTSRLIDDDDTTTTNNAIALIGNDFDGDGDIDLIGAASSSDIITLYRNPTLSIEDNIFNTEIKLYPNPCSDILTIDNQSNHIINKIDIIDNLGRTLSTKSSFKNSISIKELSIGTYFIKLYSDNKVAVKKIIKQ